MPGPVPKRSSERRRRNKDSQPQTVKRVAGRSSAPRAKASWHPVMKDWYSSLAKSAQSQFYEPSDWAEARLWCEVLSHSMRSPKGVSAFLLASFSTFSSRLLTTEGDRRRARVEIEQAAQGPAKVTSLDDFRKRAGA